jgi:hypothetical protein
MVQRLVGVGLDVRTVYALSVVGPMDAAEVQDERMGKGVEYNQAGGGGSCRDVSGEVCHGPGGTGPASRGRF